MLKRCGLLNSTHISTRSKKDFKDGLSYSTPQKVKKQGEMPLPSLGPIPLKKCSSDYCSLSANET